MKEVDVIKANSSISKSKRGKQIERLRLSAYCRVSTDSEDQLSSYASQKTYYTDLIQKTVSGFFLEFMLMKLLQEHKLRSVKIFKE